MKISERMYIQKRHDEDFVQACQQWKIDKNKLSRLIEKYHHVQYLPLDIKPIVIPSDFKEWYYSRAIPNKIGLEESDFNDLWLSTFKKAEYDFKYGTGAVDKEGSNNIADMLQIYPELISQIEEALPYSEMKSFSIYSNMRTVPRHRDSFYILSLPVSFRIILDDENDVPTYHHFQAMPSDEIVEFDDNTELDPYCFRNGIFGKDTPHDMNWSQAWTYNNLTTQHRADKHEGKRKILFIPRMTNPIDWDKFEELIDRSIKKFENEAMFDQLPLSEYVDFETH